MCSETYSVWSKKLSPFSLYESVENRRQRGGICQVEPLNRALAGQKIWIMGIHAGQSMNRHEMAQLEGEEAHVNQSGIRHLTGNIDISRGDLIVPSANPSLLSQDVEAMLCWMDAKPLSAGSKHVLQVGTLQTRGSVRVISRQNLYTQNRAKGGAILIEKTSNLTAGARTLQA